MQFNQTQVLLSIISVVTIMLMLVTIVIFILVRNYRTRLRQERDRLLLITAIQDAEQESIFRDLHEDVGPHLNSIKLKIESLTIQYDPEKFQKEIIHVKEAIENSRLMVKSIIRNIRRIYILKDGMKKSLDGLKDFIETNSKIKVEINAEDFGGEVSVEKQEQIFRCIVEMMNNSLMHSQAKNIFLDLKKSNDVIIMNYQDNGIGFDENIKHDGVGLRNIRFRLQLINGSLQFLSSANKGVTYNSVIPI